MTEESEFKKKLKGITAEVVGGVATDLATSPLLAMGPKGWVAYVGINAFQGSDTNYHFQRYLNTEEKVNWGEVVT